MAVLYRLGSVNLKKIDIENEGGFEVVVGLGNIRGLSRKLIVVACYVPPTYSGRRGNDFLAYLTDLMLGLKRKYRDPYIYVAGDFNQWDLASALADYGDLEEAPLGPTRGNRCIDRVFHNMSPHGTDLSLIHI